MRPEKPLVLGASGFLGNTLISHLIANGIEVVAFDQRESPYLRDIGVENWVVGSFQDENKLDQALADCDCVYHLISTTTPSSSNLDPFNDCHVNLLGTLRLLELARHHNIKKIVFVSSGGTVYGVPSAVPIPESAATNPICSYGIHKLAVEKYLDLYHDLYGLDYCVLRVSNPYGPLQKTLGAQGAVGVFIGKALRNEPIEIWGDGSVIRDYVHANDVAEAMLLAMQHGGSQRLFNIGSGEGRSLREIVDIIGSLLDEEIKVTYGHLRAEDVPVNILDIHRAASELGWKPRIPFAVGVADTLHHLKSQLKRIGNPTAQAHPPC